MACRVGSFSTGTGAVSSTVAVTGTGFTPTFVLFWWSGRTDTTDAAGSASHVSGFGAMSSTERIVVVAHSTDAGASAEADAGQRTDACIASMSAAGAIDGLMDFSSFDADGFTLVVDDVMPVSMRIHYMAFNSGVTNVDMGFFTEPAATGTQDVTAPGFQPDAAFFMSFSNNTGDPPMTGTDSRRSFGVAAGATPANYAWAGGSNDAAATMQTLSYCRSGDAIVGMEGAVTVTNMRGRVSSWLSTGFRITWDEVTTNNVRRILYVALKGGSWFAGDLTTATNTTAFGETGVGFQPEGVLFVSHNNSASASDTPQDHESLSIGAADSSLNQAACALIDEDNTANAEVATAVEHDEVYINLDTADAKEGGMKLNSMDSDGFTVQMTDADPSALFVWYLAWKGALTNMAASVSIGGVDGTPTIHAFGNMDSAVSMGGIDGTPVSHSYGHALSAVSIGGIAGTPTLHGVMDADCAGTIGGINGTPTIHAYGNMDSAVSIGGIDGAPTSHSFGHALSAFTLGGIDGSGTLTAFDPDIAAAVSIGGIDGAPTIHAYGNMDASVSIGGLNGAPTVHGFGHALSAVTIGGLDASGTLHGVMDAAADSTIGGITVAGDLSGLLHLSTAGTIGGLDVTATAHGFGHALAAGTIGGIVFAATIEGGQDMADTTVVTVDATQETSASDQTTVVEVDEVPEDGNGETTVVVVGERDD